MRETSPTIFLVNFRFAFFVIIFQDYQITMPIHKEIHSFDRDLMNTSLNILISGVEQNYAKSAAFDCFADVESLEQILSLYRFGSDVSCINSSEVGTVTPLTTVGTECIHLAFSASAMSKGVIDICMGEYFLKAKNDTTYLIPETPRKGKFEFDPEHFLIKKVEEGKIDLGSIGKGYAVDCVVKKLKEMWEIENAFISFGGSSIYAFGKNDENKSWQINLSDKLQIDVDDFAVGASGTSVLGNHIIDARTGKVPETQPFRTWCFCGNASIADAMATAFMLLSKDEIREVCQAENLNGAIQETPESEIIFFE